MTTTKSSGLVCLQEPRLSVDTFDHENAVVKEGCVTEISEANKFSEPLDLINKLINKSKPREVLLSKKIAALAANFFLKR